MPLASRTPYLQTMCSDLNLAEENYFETQGAPYTPFICEHSYFQAFPPTSMGESSSLFLKRQLRISKIHRALGVEIYK